MSSNLQPMAVFVNNINLFDITANSCNNPTMEIRVDTEKQKKQEHGEKLRLAREAANLKQWELAKLINVTQQTIGAIEKGKGTTLWPEIERALGLPPGYFLYGNEPSILSSPQPIIAGCPILEWTDAINWPKNKNEIVENKRFKRFSNEIVLSSNSYILRVQNDLMLSSDASMYLKEGTYVVIEPSKTPKDKDFVVTKNLNNDKLILRQYKNDDGYEYLRLLQPGHPKPVTELDSSITICGVVVLHLNLRPENR